MSISDNYAPIREIGNGTTTTFGSAKWSPISAEYLDVFLEDATTGVQTAVAQGSGPSEYQVTLTSSGFTVTFNTAPTSDNFVVIGRSVTRDQTTPYRTSKGFQGSATEDSFDKLTAITQELGEQQNRSLSYPLGSTKQGSLPADPEDGFGLVFDGVNGGMRKTQTNLDTLLEDTEDAKDAAELARDAAQASEAAAAASEAEAQTKANEALASANAAAASAAQGFFQNIVTITSADSPYTPAVSEEGTLFQLNMTAGAITVDLSELSVYGEDMKFGFVKVDSTVNFATINAGGSDTINGSSSVSLETQYETHAILGDLETASWIDSVQTTGVADNSVTNQKLTDMAQETIKGRQSGSSGDPQDLTPSQVRSIISALSQAEINTLLSSKLNKWTNETVSLSGSSTTLSSSIPSGVEEVVVVFDGLTTTDVNAVIFQMNGQTTGYVSTSTITTSGGSSASSVTSGFMLRRTSSAHVMSGAVKFYKGDGNKWYYSATVARTDNTSMVDAGGFKDISSALSSILITTTGGTATLSGNATIKYR